MPSIFIVVIDMEIIEVIRPIAERTARQLGFEVFDLKVVRRSRRLTVIVTIDLAEGSVSVSHCEEYSRAIDQELEKEDILGAPFDLVVQSPGAERPLRNIADFERFVGSYAKLVLNEPIDKRSFIVGKLEGVENDVVRITEEDSSKMYAVTFSIIKRANLKLRF